MPVGKLNSLLNHYPF